MHQLQDPFPRGAADRGPPSAVPGAAGLPRRQGSRFKPGAAGHPGSGPGYGTVRHLPSTVACVKTSQLVPTTFIYSTHSNGAPVVPGTRASAVSPHTASFKAPLGPSAARSPARCSLPPGMFLESSFLFVPQFLKAGSVSTPWLCLPLSPAWGPGAGQES